MSWNIVSFLKDAGEKILSLTQTDAQKAQALKAHLDKQGLPTSELAVAVNGGEVQVTGTTASSETLEKAVLALGNVAGIEQVTTTVKTPEASAPKSRTHTVKKGDSLGKISQEVYGNANKYQIIFEANKPMLSHPDKIYPGQVLRIPEILVEKAA